MKFIYWVTIGQSDYPARVFESMDDARLFAMRGSAQTSKSEVYMVHFSEVTEVVPERIEWWVAEHTSGQLAPEPYCVTEWSDNISMLDANDPLTYWDGDKFFRGSSRTRDGAISALESKINEVRDLRIASGIGGEA